MCSSDLLCISPVAGMMENLSALKAVIQWMSGFRDIHWEVTPSTKAADDVVNGRAQHSGRPLAETVDEAPVPWRRTPAKAPAVPAAAAAAFVVAVYIGIPLVITDQDFAGNYAASTLLSSALTAAGVIVVLVTGMIGVVWWTARPAPAHSRRRPAAHAVRQPQPAAQVSAADAETASYGVQALEAMMQVRS